MNENITPNTRRKLNFNLKKTDYIIIVAFFFLVLGILLYSFFSPNYYKQAAPAKFKVAKGETIERIIDSLYARQIIPNKFNMKVAFYLSGEAKNIKAGNYYIPNGLSYFGLIDLFVNQPHSRELLVAIPEGIWQYKLAGFLHRKIEADSAKIMQLTRDSAFIAKLNLNTDNLEGYLLPEGYYFWADVKPEEILERLKLEQDKVFNDSVNTRIAKLKMTKKQILTLASIIDGESNNVKEFKRISGVYHNRLRTGMPLQADPTVQYIVREAKNGGLARKDFEINSPYNTYKHAGLPPGPINNPGRDAILAAVFPERHNYLYFVADGTGSHVFDRTFPEHEKNVAKYKKWLKSKRP
jgi:UPF0755 protein